MRKLPPEDIELFRTAMQNVKRLPAADDKVPPSKPRPKTRSHRIDQKAASHINTPPSSNVARVETGDILAYRRVGVSQKTFNQLRRGRYKVEMEFDLHGMTVLEARRALNDFIAEALAQHKYCIRIIHGKGHRSGPQGPVLKNVVNVWLRHCTAVTAFVSAQQADGGTGAVHVLLCK